MVDTPFPQLFPALLAAFPNASVCHTLRGSVEWAVARAEDHGSASFARTLEVAPKPFAGVMARMADVIGVARNPKTGRMESNPHTAALRMEGGLKRSTAHPAAVLFSAHNLFVRCSVPASQYMAVQIVAGEACVAGWMRRLAVFVQRPCLGPCASFTVPGCDRARDGHRPAFSMHHSRLASSKGRGVRTTSMLD